MSDASSPIIAEARRTVHEALIARFLELCEELQANTDAGIRVFNGLCDELPVDKDGALRRAQSQMPAIKERGDIITRELDIAYSILRRSLRYS
jgi:hypothetical protein